MNRFFVIPAAAALLLSAACDNQNAKPQPAPTPAPTPQQVVGDQDLAVQADFEEESEKAITPANYKQELEAAKAEVSGT